MIEFKQGRAGIAETSQMELQIHYKTEIGCHSSDGHKFFKQKKLQLFNARFGFELERLEAGNMDAKGKEVEVPHLDDFLPKAQPQVVTVGSGVPFALPGLPPTSEQQPMSLSPPPGAPGSGRNLQKTLSEATEPDDIHLGGGAAAAFGDFRGAAGGGGQSAAKKARHNARFEEGSPEAAQEEANASFREEL